MTGAYLGRRVLVTGGSRGVGAALAAWLASEGAKILAIGRSKQISPVHGVEYLPLDLSRAENMTSLIAHATKFEPDTVVHALGGGFGLSDDMISPQDFLHLLRLNFLR